MNGEDAGRDQIVQQVENNEFTFSADISLEQIRANAEEFAVERDWNKVRGSGQWEEL